MHVTGWMLLLPAVPPAEPRRVRQGRVLNKGPHINCSLESQTSSSDCWDFITVKAAHVTITASVMERT